VTISSIMCYVFPPFVEILGPTTPFSFQTSLTPLSAYLNFAKDVHCTLDKTAQQLGHVKL